MLGITCRRRKNHSQHRAGKIACCIVVCGTARLRFCPRALLIADAMRRAYASASFVGSSMLVVDAIGEQAAAFYAANGLLRLPDSLRLVLPVAEIGKLIGR